MIERHTASRRPHLPHFVSPLSIPSPPLPFTRPNFAPDASSPPGHRHSPPRTPSTVGTPAPPLSPVTPSLPDSSPFSQARRPVVWPGRPAGTFPPPSSMLHTARSPPSDHLHPWTRNARGPSTSRRRGSRGNGPGGGGDGEAETMAAPRTPTVGRRCSSSCSSRHGLLASAIEGDCVTGEIVRRFADMDSSPLLRCLMQFRGFWERLLTDDLFLAKLAMECGVGVMAKTAPEFQKRGENFVNEIDVVISDALSGRWWRMGRI